MFTAYNLLLNLAFILSFPYLLLRAAWGKHGIKERMGFLSQDKLEKISSKRVIWLHAASVGEIKALSTIIPQIRKDHPEYALVVSTITKSGKKEAERTLKEIEFVFLLPVDLKRFVGRALNKIQPKALILVETELWPNLIRETKKRGCLIAMINGRISHRSFKRYLAVRSLFRQTLCCFDLLCVQSEEYKDRLIRLGACPDKTRVTGNLKYDRLLYASKSSGKDQLKRKLGIADKYLVIIGGSIRSGEEQILLRVFTKLKSERDNLLFILAPRHLDKLNEVERVLSGMKLSFVRRSKLDGNIRSDQPEVILLDTMGELSGLYALADVAFVGGSLVPVGGHNLLEPAIYGVPVAFGPYTDHFKEEAKILIESGGGIQVKSEEELTLKLSSLIADTEKRVRLGQSAKTAIWKETGVSKRTTDLIFSFLENQ
ncbi:MAG: 3-deoxy-D-manno-octulosonic acid transferase [Candidatus Zixiibacteriota bacterium]